MEAFLWPGTASRTVIVFGGFHGDEPKSVTLSRRLIDFLESSDHHCGDVQWIIEPLVNPDGFQRRNRRNGNGVDINRNFPTNTWQRTSKRGRMFGGETPGSEPETQAVLKVIERYRPSCIITIHSISGRRYCNNYDGPGRAIAQAMGRCNGYPIKASLGYPTPGSFGTWAGRERAIPTITLELPSHHSAKRCWEDNRHVLPNAVQRCG